MGILAQYIGPPSRTPSRISSQANNGEATGNQKLKELFLENTDKQDKMKGHHKTLTRAVAWDRLPAKLRIQ